MTSLDSDELRWRSSRSSVLSSTSGLAERPFIATVTHVTTRHKHQSHYMGSHGLQVYAYRYSHGQNTLGMLFSCRVSASCMKMRYNIPFPVTRRKTQKVSEEELGTLLIHRRL